MSEHPNGHDHDPEGIHLKADSTTYEDGPDTNIPDDEVSAHTLYDTAAERLPEPDWEPVGVLVSDGDPLDADQRERVAALHAAREVLAARQMFGSAGTNPGDVIRVARYICTGVDPADAVIEQAMREQEAGS